MTITLNGTSGITTPAVTNDGAYTGDGISFADGTPSNTLVTDTSGNVGIGGTPVSLASTKTLTVTDATEARIQLQNTASGSTSADGVSLAINGTDFYVNNRENGNIITYVNGAERMRIDSSGNLLVNTTSVADVTGSSNPATGSKSINAISQDDSALNLKRTSSNGAIAYFARGGVGVIGSISITTSATAYNTSSDYRLKENIAPMIGALAIVQQLKPVTYNWKVDGSSGQGFIAHELAEVVPDCVTGEKDAVETYIDEEGIEQTRPVYQGIDTSFLVATLTAAIQEQQAIITEQSLALQDLKARIETLENK